jgi:hypothetical protein
MTDRVATEESTKALARVAESIKKTPSLNELFQDIVNSGNVQLVEWLLFGFIVVGIIIKSITFSIYSDLTPQDIAAGVKPVGPATGTIWGYSVILFAAMGLVFISVNPQKDNMEQLKDIPISLFAIVILLMWSIVLNFRFYEKINTTRKMPYNYELWNTWSLITVMMLSFFAVIEYLVNTINQGKYRSFKGQIKVYSLVVFFTGIIVVGIQDSILNNFLVDG